MQLLALAVFFAFVDAGTVAASQDDYGDPWQPGSRDFSKATNRCTMFWTSVKGNAVFAVTMAANVALLVWGSVLAWSDGRFAAWQEDSLLFCESISPLCGRAAARQLASLPFRRFFHSSAGHKIDCRPACRPRLVAACGPS